MASPPEVIIYTDGACKGNPGPGGWAARLIHCPTGKVRDIAGHEAHTTNNRMEMTAALEGLRSLTRPKVRVNIKSDSSYLVQAFRQNWLDNWRRNGWRTSSKKDVENQDLWLALLEAAGKHLVVWEHVKGHAGHEHNEACDLMAREQSELAAEELSNH